MRYRVLSSVVVAALVVAGCGGDDDEVAVGDLGEITEDADEPSDEGDSDSDDESSDEGPGFGGFVSGSIVLTGAEEVTYAVDDPALGFVSGGGCGGENYGLSVNVQNAEAQVTMAQISVNIDEDMSGGRTGTFPAEEVSLIVIPDGDMMSSRTYDGPGTLEASAVDAPEGTVELDADLVWVMGCP